MMIAAKLDDWGLPAWIAFMIAGFVIWWPVGLVILAFLIGSGRMGCGHGGYGRFEHKMVRLQEKLDRMRGSREHGGRWWQGTSSSGNRAFDEYKDETLRRLEDEQREFKEFLDRLRFSKDRAEFDQFMTDRRNRPASSAPPQG